MEGVEGVEGEKGEGEKGEGRREEGEGSTICICTSKLHGGSTMCIFLVDHFAGGFTMYQEIVLDP